MCKAVEAEQLTNCLVDEWFEAEEWVVRLWKVSTGTQARSRITHRSTKFGICHTIFIHTLVILATWSHDAIWITKGEVVEVVVRRGLGSRCCLRTLDRGDRHLQVRCRFPSVMEGVCGMLLELSSSFAAEFFRRVVVVEFLSLLSS
jgi:hypothetical protein